MKNQHHHQALAKKGWRKINTSTLSATAIASASLASMYTGILIDIEQPPPILHPEQPSAENFPYFSGQKTQHNFLQWKGPLESSSSTSRKKGAWSSLILEERIECMHAQEVVERQNVNSHKLSPSLLIWIICILSGVYKFLSGIVRFLVDKFVNRKVIRSQRRYNCY